MSKKRVKSKKDRIREIKSKVKIREIKGKAKVREIDSKKEPIKIGENIEEIVNESELGRFLQAVKAPVLEKIANAQEMNLEQIAFAQARKEKEEDEGVSYIGVKSDYTTTQREEGTENGTQYTDSSGDYSKIIEDDKTEKERKRDLSGMRQTIGSVKKRKKWGSWESQGFSPESDSKKYMTGGL